MFRAPLQQSKLKMCQCLPTLEWVTILGYSHITEYYTLKKKKVKIHTAKTWMNLTNNMWTKEMKEYILHHSIFIMFKSKQINVSCYHWDQSGVVGTNWDGIYSLSDLYGGKNKLWLLCKVIKIHTYDMNPSACTVYSSIKYT